MGRPESNTVKQFLHDTDTQNRKTVCTLERKYKNDGYAFWFKLLEMLGSTENHYIDCRDSATWEFFVAKMGVEESFCTGILDTLVKLKAIDKELWTEFRVIWCQGFVNRLKNVYEKRTGEIPLKPSFRDGNPVSAEKPEAETEHKEAEIPLYTIYTKGINHTNKRGGSDLSDLPSPYFALAKRIIESAAEFDARNVGLNKDTPSQRKARLKESAEDIRKLIEISWSRWDLEKALVFSNQIWDWVLVQHKSSDGKGFSWRKNIRSGYKFRYHCDSQLKYKGKEGGELLRQYRASPEYADIQRKNVQKTKAKPKPQEPIENEEEWLEKIREEQGDEAWARALFEIGFKMTPEKVQAIPALKQLPRVQEALRILGKNTGGHDVRS